MASSATADLVSICSVEDIFHRHLLPFLAHEDAARLEQTCKALSTLVEWKILCGRDFSSLQRSAPALNRERQSFDALKEASTWKEAYQQWHSWKNYTFGSSSAEHLLQAMDLWARLKAVLGRLGLTNVLDSLSPGMDSAQFGILKDKIPSSLAALYCVHGGQELLQARSQDHEFFAGLLGSYACYNNYYSMRLLKMSEFGPDAVRMGHIMVAVSPGNPRMFLYLCPTDQDPEGHLTVMYNNPISHQSIQFHHPVVGRGGILNYLRQYVEQLEAGVYQPTQIIEESSTSRGIGVFPDAGPLCSQAVTRRIEVRSSARWFPAGPRDQYGLNFGYSIRIQMVEEGETCQLVGRHWEFMDGNGEIKRVDGEAVVGKQPLFFWRNGKAGYIDLGPAGDGSEYEDKVFVYQSQSGPVEGTTQENTGQASVSGKFSFLPGSIENPTGELFYATVGTFPLKIPHPFF